MADKCCRVNRACVSVNQELLWRHALDADAALCDYPLDFNIVQLGHRHHRDSTRHRVNHRLRLTKLRIVIFLDDGDETVRLLLNQHLGAIVQAGVLLHAHRGGLGPPSFDDATLAHQRVLEGAVQHRETGVVLVQDVVGVIGGLLGCRHILLGAGHILHGFLGTEEDPHDAGQHTVHRVAHLGGHNLALALFLVAEQVAAVVGSRLRTVRAQVAVDVTDGVRDLGGHDGLQLSVIHRRVVARFLCRQCGRLALKRLGLGHRVQHVIVTGQDFLDRFF